MITSDYTTIITELKTLIDENGPDYINANPYDVYQHLLNTEDCDRKLADALLYILVSGTAEGLGDDGYEPDIHRGGYW